MYDWDFLKKNKYFNPYEKYETYQMRLLDSLNHVFDHQNYEEVIIESKDITGEMFILFKKDRFIIALEILLSILNYETSVIEKKINIIYFNNTKIYDKNEFSFWERLLNLEEEENKFKLICLAWEDLLIDNNKIIIKFEENLEYFEDSRLRRYHALDFFIFYKIIKGYDENYFLREFYDIHKIK